MIWDMGQPCFLLSMATCRQAAVPGPGSHMEAMTSILV